MKKVTPTDLFLAVLAVMLISVSFYQTWLGLEQIFGGSAFVVALVLSLILLFLLWQIRKARTNGSSTSGLSWIYTFFALFCFVANFNALYTRFMRTDIYASELRDINKKFNNLESEVESKLDFSVKDPKVRQAIVDEIPKLKMQIADPGRLGEGDEARNILVKIERLLGNNITRLRPVNKTVAGYQDQANRYEQQILQMTFNLPTEQNNLLQDIKEAEKKWNFNIQNLLTKPQSEVDKLAQNQIDASSNEYNKLGNKANLVLGSEKMKFEPIVPKTQEVGKIGYAFNHAISNFGMFQFVVFAGCILLDFGIMLIILLMPTESNNTNTSVFSQKRTGKTIV